MTLARDIARIGGELELEPEDLQFAPAQESPGALPTTGQPCELWLNSGRAALLVIARDLRARGASGRVWIPAYCCESVIAPFLAAGFEIRFYGVGAKLEGCDARPNAADAVLFIHYFGRRSGALRARAQALRESGVWVIEDCVQAGLTAGVGAQGHYSVSSLRKILPQPDGALLASSMTLQAAVEPPDEGFISARVCGKLLRGAGTPDATFLDLFAWSEQRLEESVPRAMSWLSRGLLGRANLAQVGDQRRSNWHTLRGLIGRNARLAGLGILLDELEAGEVPLGFPVRVPRGQRDTLRRALAGHRIYCPVHWDLSHVPRDGFGDEQALAASLLTLPLDQRYGAGEMASIVNALDEFSGDLT